MKCARPVRVVDPQGDGSAEASATPAITWRSPAGRALLTPQLDAEMARDKGNYRAPVLLAVHAVRLGADHPQTARGRRSLAAVVAQLENRE